MFALTSLAPSTLAVDEFHKKPADVIYTSVSRETKAENITVETSNSTSRSSSKRCATVEEMGEVFKGDVWEESLRVRKLIQNHFLLNGTSTSCSYNFLFVVSFVFFFLDVRLYELEYD